MMRWHFEFTDNILEPLVIKCFGGKKLQIYKGLIINMYYSYMETIINMHWAILRGPNTDLEPFFLIFMIFPLYIVFSDMRSNMDVFFKIALFILKISGVQFLKVSDNIFT